MNNTSNSSFRMPITFLQGIVISFLILIYAGYVLRGLVSYNFESVFILVILTLLLARFYGPKLDAPRELFVFSTVFLTYLFVVVIAVLLFHDIGEITLNKFRIIALIPAFLLLSWLIFYAKLSIDYFWYLLIVCSLIVFYWGFLEFQHLSIERILLGSRLGDYYGNSIKFGVYANALFILMLGGLYWSYKKSKLLFSIWVLFTICNLILVIFSQTRTAWIGWPEAIIGWTGYYLFLIWKSSLGNRKKVLITITPILFIVFISTNKTVQTIFDNRAQQAINQFSGYVAGESFDNSIGQRLVMYETAAKLIIDKPFVGYGPEGFREIFKGATSSTVMDKFGIEYAGLHYHHVHNQFLMTWVQYGVIPVVVLLIIFIYLAGFFIKGIKNSESEDKPIFIAGLVFTVATFLAFMPESPLEYSSYSAHYLFFLNLLFVFSLNVKKSLKLKP